MTAPRRIIDDPAMNDDIRKVVRSVRALDPHYDVTRGVARFHAMLEAGPNVDTAKGVGMPLATKLLAFAGVLGVGFGATYLTVASRSAPMVEASAPPALVALPSNAPEQRSSAADVPSVSVDALPSASAPASGSAFARAPAGGPAPGPSAGRDVAAEREREVRHLVELQRVAASDPARAIVLARAGHAEFPRGALVQEREIILIDALVHEGETREAGERARSFVRTYPKSAAVAHMRAIAGEPAP